uniref:non-specific serine/threonine protein kinase n=1 Tax=Solanum tuberosum TaxID=4113 RepID=M1AUZ0_SOLTU
MTSEFSRRKSFITSSIKTARLYGFQGLDLNGVYPNTAANMTNMRTFIEEWRTTINSESNNSLILTMGAYYSPMLDQSMKYPVETIVRNFDWVHLRSYDYYLPSKNNVTRAHSALYDPSSTRNTDYGIKEWIKNGLPANKIVIGLAYHGYAWTLENPNHNMVGSPARGPAITSYGSSINYKNIKGYMKSNGAILVYNSTYVVNYVTIGPLWIGYDDVEAIRTKVSYAKDKGLRGFAAFQIPNDDVDWELSKAGRNLKVFSFGQIKEATNNFSIKNKIGEGGFGPVYKGRLSDGQEIAVKRLSEYSKQGVEEFQNEVSLASKLQHVNVLQLQGFCIEKEEKILVYEYMSNRSLDFYLYGARNKLLIHYKIIRST